MFDTERKLLIVNLIITILVLIGVVFMFFGRTSVTESEDVFDSLIQKLSEHEELSNYAEVYPRITRLDQASINLLLVNNLTFYQDAEEGNYLLEYVGLTLIYDYENNEIVNVLSSQVLPPDFSQRLFAHAEVQDHREQDADLTLITEDSLVTARQNNPDFFENAEAGYYLLQWQDLSILYNYEDDVILNLFRLQLAPADLLAKLTAHPELNDYANQVPRVSIVTEDVLPELQEQFPNIYANAYAGNFVLRFDDKLVLYDYENDVLVANFDLVQA